MNQFIQYVNEFPIFSLFPFLTGIALIIKFKIILHWILSDPMPLPGSIVSKLIFVALH